MVAIDSPIRVLVLDDDAVDREQVRRALRAMVPPPELVEAASAREAEHQLRNGTFDCVLLDYLLPEGPCLDVIDDLRGLAPQAAFVVLTGQGDESVAVELMKAGASDYLSKEMLDPSRLRGAIKFAVALRRAQAAAARAKAERDRHADQLRRFVTRAPELVAARSTGALAETVCELARDVIDAVESCFVLHLPDAEVLAGVDLAQPSELYRWSSELLGADKLSNSCVRSQDRAAVGLMARDGSCRGALSAQLPDNADHNTQEQLLCQLGVLASISCDNLLLYDAAARAVRSRDDIMAVVSHDLRTPLNNIRLGASLLRETLDEKSQSVIERLDRNVTMMARLADDLVDMVRLESGLMELRKVQLSVSDLLEDAQDLVSGQAAAGGQRFEVRLPESPLTVHADRERVLQVLSNLLGNAFKFTPASGTISLAAGADGSFVRFAVLDSGPGIPAEEGDKVFARFWQSDPKRRRGLGLGLYIAKGLIVAHGGTLWYESERGQGTSFYFTLPAAAQAEHPPGRSA